MSELPQRNPESDKVSGLAILTTEAFQVELSYAQYRLSTYVDDREGWIDDMQENLLQYFPDKIYTSKVDYSGIATWHDKGMQFHDALHALQDMEFLGFFYEKIKESEKIVMRFAASSEDEEWFDVDPAAQNDIAQFEFHAETKQPDFELDQELSRQARNFQMTVRSKDFLNATYDDQQDILSDLSRDIAVLFEKYQQNSQAIMGIQCSGYYATPTELYAELDWDECYVDLDDNPYRPQYPEGRLLEVGLAEQFLHPDKTFRTLEDLYFSGGMPFIILKPAGHRQFYWIDTREMDGSVWSVDTMANPGRET